MNPKISIIIPVFNEMQNVKILYDEIISAVAPLGYGFELIFIDDRSTDGTFEQLQAIKKQGCKKINALFCTRIIRFARNFGQTAAMQAGFDHARGDVIISLDGDLQNDPHDIPKLLKKLEEGFDVVCGWRKDRMDKTLTRIVPSKVANWIISKVTGVPIHDNGCSLKAYRSSAIKSLRLYSDMHRFIPAMSTIGGAKIAEIIVNHRPRKYGETKYGLSRIWKVLFDIITVKMVIHFHDRPMWWFSIFGFLFCILGFGFGVAFFILFLRGEQSVVFSAASFLSFFLFGSLISWGILAEFFVRVEKSIYPPRLIE